MKVVQNGFIVARKDSFSTDIEFMFREYDASKYGNDTVLVGTHTIEFEVPENFDPREGMVSILERQKQELTAAFHAKVTEINGQIQSLLAIENNPTVEVEADFPF